MESYLDTLRLFNRDVRLYLAATILFGFSLFGGITSLLFNLYLLRLGYGPTFVGWVSATGALSFAIFSLPAGLMGARWDPRRVMIAGIGIAIIGNGLLSQAELVVSGAPRDVFVLATNALGLLGVALYIVNGAPYLMGIAGARERNHVFSMQGALFPLAGFFGSLVGGFLPGRIAWLMNVAPDHPAPFRFTLLAASALLIPALFILMATRKPQVRQRQVHVEDSDAPFPLGVIALIALASLLHVAGEGAVRTFFNVYLDAGLHVPTSLIGTLMAAGQLLAVPAALTVPLFTGRFGNHHTVVLSAICTPAMLIPMAFLPHWIPAGFCFMNIVALASIRRPAFVVYNQEIVSPRWRATMSGASSMMAGIGYSVIAMGGGYIISTVGYHALFLTSAAFTALGTLIFWAYFRTPRGEFAPASISNTS